MRRLVTITLGLALIWGRTVLGAPGAEAQQVFAKVSPALVTVLIFDAQGQSEGQGSGVIIGAGQVVSNCHVVRGAHQIKVMAGTQAYPARWELQDPQRDLCLLRVDGLTASYPPIRKGADIPVGEPVYAIGNPLGFGLTVSEGLVARVQAIQGESMIVFSAPISPGSSGGGLFDRQGRLLGITTSRSLAGQNLNHALPAEALAALLVRGKAPPAPIKVPAPETDWPGTAKTLADSADWQGVERHARAWRASQPRSAAAASSLADALSRMNRLTEAEAVLREAVTLDDRNLFVWRGLAMALFRLGREADAEQALSTAQALVPSSGFTRAIRAEWRLIRNRLPEARAELDEALRLEPGVSWHWQLLGRLEDQSGHADAAAKAYRVALRLSPGNPEAAQGLGRQQAHAGELDKARVTLSQSKQGGREEGMTWLAIANGELQRKRYAAAESAFRKAAELAPDMPQGFLGMGLVMTNTNRAAEALTWYEQALALPAPAREFTAETLQNRAATQLMLNNRQAALADAERAIELSPGLTSAHRLLGGLWMEARDYQRAVAAFRQVVEQRAATADDLASLGEALEKSGDKPGASEALQQAERLEPKNIHVLQALAGFHGRSGELQQALGYLDRALAIDSANASSWSSKGYAQLKLGQLEAAMASLQTAVSLNPALSNGWINLGEAYMRSGKMADAIRALEKALTLAPNALDARLFLSLSYLRAQMPTLAQEQATLVLARQPNQPEALGVMVYTALMDGKTAVAGDYFRQLRASNPVLAGNLRAQALRLNLKGAGELPE